MSIIFKSDDDEQIDDGAPKPKHRVPTAPLGYLAGAPASEFHQSMHARKRRLDVITSMSGETGRQIASEHGLDELGQELAEHQATQRAFLEDVEDLLDNFRELDADTISHVVKALGGAAKVLARVKPNIAVTAERNRGAERPSEARAVRYGQDQEQEQDLRGHRRRGRSDRPYVPDPPCGRETRDGLEPVERARRRLRLPRRGERVPRHLLLQGDDGGRSPRAQGGAPRRRVA